MNTNEKLDLLEKRRAEARLGGGQARIGIKVAGDNVVDTFRFIHAPEAWQRNELSSLQSAHDHTYTNLRGWLLASIENFLARNKTLRASDGVLRRNPFRSHGASEGHTLRSHLASSIGVRLGQVVGKAHGGAAKAESLQSMPPQ